MFGTTARPGGPKKPTIRRETVTVPVKKQGAAGTLQRPTPAAGAARTPASNRFQLTERAGVRKPAPPVKKTHIPSPARRALDASRGIKRKSITPQSPAWSSEESGDESGDQATSDSDASRKRIKSSVHSIDSTLPRRDLVLPSAFDTERQQGKVDIIHGAAVTSGAQADKFVNPWNAAETTAVELQYPSFCAPERFELKWPKNEREEYRPVEDIIESVKSIITCYLPADLSTKYTSGDHDFERRLRRAWTTHQSLPEFASIVMEFNAVLKPLLEDGTIKRELANMHSAPLDLVRRIIDQIYWRAVSPRVELLRAYQNGTDNVYGEILSRFTSEIFDKTSLNHEHVFVDLGSGVGNAVIQAALERGCESWGIEMMKNPCDLAETNEKEFRARTQLWGLKVGNVRLLRGDFTVNDEIRPVLTRADVVLVNNQAFTPALNDKLRDMFLDLKDGCRVVSLKPFVPEGHKINNRNAGSSMNLFVQQRFEYFSGSVSWTDVPGFYYVATKDRRPYEKFIASQKKRGIA